MKHPTSKDRELVAIGNGLYFPARKKGMSLLELYREKQRACPHEHRDPRGMCRACGAKEAK